MEKELLLPGNSQGFSLVSHAIYLIQARNIRITREATECKGSLDQVYEYAKDILFVNYTHDEARLSQQIRYDVNRDFPDTFCNVINGVLKYRFNRPIDSIHGASAYGGNGVYCICIPLPEKILIMEKLCWESMLGANSYYQCMKMNEFMLNTAKYEPNSSWVNAGVHSTAKVTSVEITGRKFLFDPENQNV
jgi:hypothetical protein